MRTLVILGLLCFSLVPGCAQELGPKDIDPKTEDLRCVEKNYRHKTARELAKMTAEQLIDEKEKDRNYHGSMLDEYGMFTLARYTDKIGIEIVPVLIKISYEFKSRPFSKCQESRFFSAFAIAGDVDDQVVRLRTVKDGRTAILAAEAALERMKLAGLADQNTYNMYPFGLSLLNWVTGINQHDEMMREVLKSEYKIQLTEDEFINFVKFLTSTYATYPSWTPRINSGRDLQANKKKYHEAYLKFKGSSKKRVSYRQLPPELLSRCRCLMFSSLVSTFDSDVWTIVADG